MLKGLSRYSLTADGNNKPNLQLRADGGFSSARNSSGGTAGNSSVFSQTGGTRGGSSRIVTDARFEKRLMDDFIDYQNNDMMRSIARDMLFHDPISGTAVKLMATIPFSDFEVTAVPELEKDKHIASLNAMNMRELLPEIALEKKTEGKHLSMMNFDDDKGTFTGIIPFDPALCDLTYLPVYGRDPVVDVRVSQHLQNLVASADPRVKSELEAYADDVLEMIKTQGTFPVPPEFLLYVANRAFSYMPAGVSDFRRIAAVWLYEKNLARGTMDMSSRRQKALIHAVLGDDEFIPTNQQLAEVGEMIANAERNPVGSMIVTRPGLDISEVGDNGAGIWRWDEAYDFFTTTKLRGLGLSDSIFGDFSVQEAENTLSSVIEMMTETRDSITDRVLVKRVGLTIAVKNDFKKAKRDLTADDADPRAFHARNTISSRSSFMILGNDGEVINPEDYSIPQYRYKKVLRLASNTALFEAMNTFSEKMPIPLKMMAASLGQSAEEIADGYDEDIKLQNRIAEYRKKLPKTAAPPGEDGGDSADDDGGIFASDGRVGLRNIPKPNFDHMEVRDPQTRRLMTEKGRRIWADKKNKTILAAADRVRDHLDRKAKAHSDAEEPGRKFYHSRR